MEFHPVGTLGADVATSMLCRPQTGFISDMVPVDPTSISLLVQKAVEGGIRGIDIPKPWGPIAAFFPPWQARHISRQTVPWFGL